MSCLVSTPSLPRSSVDEATTRTVVPLGNPAHSSKGRIVRSKGAYVLSAGVSEDAIERGLEVVFTEAERAARFGFTASELERQKVDLLRGIERAYADRANRRSASYAAEYSRAFLDGESIPGIAYEYELYRRFVPGIRLEDVNQVGSDWIRPENRVVVVTGPEKEGLEMPSEEALLVLCSQSLFRFADLGDDGLCRGGPDKGCGVIVSAIDVVVDRLD